VDLEPFVVPHPAPSCLVETTLKSETVILSVVEATKFGVEDTVAPTWDSDLDFQSPFFQQVAEKPLTESCLVVYRAVRERWNLAVEDLLTSVAVDDADKQTHFAAGLGERLDTVGGGRQRTRAKVARDAVVAVGPREERLIEFLNQSPRANVSVVPTIEVERSERYCRIGSLFRSVSVISLAAHQSSSSCGAESVRVAWSVPSAV